jgi:ADP-ribose pyrophosphatase YjhB (NUDIX family)
MHSTPATFDQMREGSLIQYGALPYRLRKPGVVDYLVVTSRGTGRWIFPKGGLVKGKTAAQSAAQEALEEAGVRGRLHGEPIGVYRTTKQRPRPISVTVLLFALQVEEMLERWPEQGQRIRKWASLAELNELLTDDGAAQLIAKFDRIMRIDISGQSTRN